MSILRKLNMGAFWLTIFLIMFPGNAMLYGEQKLPDNSVDTVLTWVNQARVNKGLEKLSIDPKLNRAAQAHSEKMAEHNMLSDNDPALGTPFERIKSSGLSDIINLVSVARAKNPDLLRQQIESQENLPKILSTEMTHAGIGIYQDSTGILWLTIHMTERAISFTQFILRQTNTDPAGHSITVTGNTPYKKMEVILTPPEGSNLDLEVDRILVPDSNGDFEITLTLGTATGSFDFEFYVEKDGEYKLKNSFSMNI